MLRPYEANPTANLIPLIHAIFTTVGQTSGGEAGLPIISTAGALIFRHRRGVP